MISGTGSGLSVKGVHHHGRTRTRTRARDEWVGLSVPLQLPVRTIACVLVHLSVCPKYMRQVAPATRVVRRASPHLHEAFCTLLLPFGMLIEMKFTVGFSHTHTHTQSYGQVITAVPP